MRSGLSDKTSAGHAGSYRGLTVEEFLLTTALARTNNLYTAKYPGHPLGGPELPAEHKLVKTEGSWTGLRREYAWGKNDGLIVELRNTLPGMLLIPRQKELNLRLAFYNEASTVKDIVKGKSFSNFDRKQLGPALLLSGGVMPSLIVADQPVVGWHIVSSVHINLRFGRPGAKVLWIPLLRDKDVPSKEKLRIYSQLLKRPPLHCKEEFEIKNRRVYIRQMFRDGQGKPSLIAPIAPFMSLTGNEGKLQKIPQGKQLLKGLLGPYRYVKGSTLEYEVDSRWMDTTVKTARPVKGKLPEIPRELCYAGDVSWDPVKEPMDGLIVLNTWAPLAGVTPEHTWKKIKERFRFPTVSSFKKSLIEVDDPMLGKSHLKNYEIFGERGECAFDADWYSGKELSGMYRALTCKDPEIRRKAERFIPQVKKERAGLLAYAEMAFDWATSVPWTDPRGVGWDPDCSRFLLGGAIGECKMREWEGDHKGADWCRYLVAKMSIAFMASYPFGDWSREVDFTVGSNGHQKSTTVGVRTVYESMWIGSRVMTAASKSVASICPDFPEFMALLKKHGPVWRWRKVAKEWERKYPGRYKDWMYYYTGLKQDRAKNSNRQEEREQAAVHYLVAPEIALRLLVLKQDPDQVEKLYKRKPTLAETLWIRCAPRLVFN